MITLADVRAARERVAGVIRPTPLFTSESLSALAGRQVLCKPEHLQRTGSYKIRGAYNLLAQLDPGCEVVAASAGNHGQAVALAGSLTGHRATIVMPATAALPKIEATRSYGGQILLEPGTVDDCIAAARAHAERTGAVYVPPFDHPEVIAGQGTVGLEIAEDAPAGLEAVVVPVGGGGLVSGVSAALAHSRRDVRVYGVEASGAASMRASLTAGRCVTLDAVSTLADGIALKSPSELTLAHVKAYVDDVLTVTDEETSRALLLLLERAKAVVEPAGAVALAAVLGQHIPGNGPVVVVLSGGNVDPLVLVKLIDHGLSAAGRYLVLRVVLGDRPGALAGLTAALADMHLNVLAVEHHRSGVRLGVDEVEVLLTLETRDPEHRLDVVADLRTAGYEVELVR